MWVADRAHRSHFVHQHLVDVKATGGIENHHIVSAKTACLHRALRNVDRLLPVDDGQGRDLRLLAENGQWLLRGRAIYIERRHQYFFLVAGLQPQAEFRRRGGLT